MVIFSTPFPEIESKQNINTVHFCKLKKLAYPIIYALAFIGFLTLILAYNLIGLIKPSGNIIVPTIPQNAIIKLNFDDKYPENADEGLLMDFENQLSFFDLIKYLNIAAFDDNVKAVVAEVNQTKLGLAQIQTLQKVIKNLSSRGKTTYVYSSGMGNLGGGLDEYYLASAFDEIWMQPNSELGITGINMEVPFIGGTLEKFGITPEFYARYEYKNAAASFTNEKMPRAYRQELQKTGKGIFNTIVDGIADNRNLPTKDILEDIDQAPLTAEEAHNHNLIDKIGYRSDLFNFLKKEYQGGIIKFSDYIANFETGSKRIPAVAFLALEGTITDGDDELSLQNITSARVLHQIEEIEKNKNIKALILRINSPGGSYTASNEIWHALNMLKREKNIPIVVSMGDYAASGGYFIALSGDKILAEPSTITGSIGVLGGKIVMSELWKKLNANWESVSFGKNAGITSSARKFSPSEKKAFNKSLDNIYKDFTQKVSAARNIEITALDRLARGRIWLGSDAEKNGLIDKIGGIDEALAQAKELAGIAPNEKFNLIYYPKPKTFAEKMSALINRAPQIAINRLQTQIGLDIDAFNVLQQMQYDSILMPFHFNM